MPAPRRFSSRRLRCHHCSALPAAGEPRQARHTLVWNKRRRFLAPAIPGSWAVSPTEQIWTARLQQGEPGRAGPGAAWPQPNLLMPPGVSGAGHRLGDSRGWCEAELQAALSNLPAAGPAGGLITRPSLLCRAAPALSRVQPYRPPPQGGAFSAQTRMPQLAEKGIGPERLSACPKLQSR